LILGLPDENRDDREKTATEIARLQPETIKLHNLYVVRGTRLAERWETGTLRLPSLEEYAAMVVDFLERQSPSIVVDRISGEAPPEYLLAPDWTGIKHAARNAVDQEFRRRGTFQGSYAD
jgi:radical SAM superfamily enzyme